ncbi:MAG TPA: hydrolase [Pirellulaceae bacterium]
MTVHLPRHPQVLLSQDSALLIVDVQTKLVGLIPDRQSLVWNLERLTDGAAHFEVPILATEQYPRGLGGTVEELRDRVGQPTPKDHFSCGVLGDMFLKLQDGGRSKLVVAGIETHVCVLQTVLDLLTTDFDVYVVVDAVGSRHRLDHEVALRRMESQGAVLVTTESVLFEWCEQSGTPQFRKVSELIRQLPPKPAL